MLNQKKMCLNCRSYRLSDELSGLCRVDKGKIDIFPVMLHESVCAHWTNCGQHYYIRLGWLKSRKARRQNIVQQ